MLSALAAELDHRDAAETLRRARSLMSSAAGIVGGVRAVPRPPDEPDVTCVGAVGAAPLPAAVPGRPVRPSLHAGGVGVGWLQAAARGVGEILERYAAYRLDPDRLRVAAWEDLGGPPPHEYERFSPAQWAAGLPYARFEAGTVLEWIPGEDLASRTPVWIPGKRVGLAPPHGCWRAEIGPTTSTGLACGRSHTRALLGGLLEVIERDAFALTWWRQLPTTPVRLPDHGPLARLVRERFERTGLSLVFRLLPTDLGIPVMLVLLVDRGAAYGAAAAGAAAHLDPSAALLKALLEAAQTRAWLLQMGGGAGFDPGPTFEHVRRFSDHVRLFGRPESLLSLSFLLETAEPPVDLEDLSDRSDGPAADLAHCLDRLAGCDLGALGVDLTPPELAACGFVVVRVVVPGTADVAPSHAHRFLGSRRLWEVPTRLGLPGGTQLNDYPHPFP